MKHWPLQIKRIKAPWPMVLLVLAAALTTINLLVLGVPFNPTAALLSDSQAVPNNTFTTAFSSSFTSVADSDIEQKKANQNNGTGVQMTIQSKSNQNLRSFVRFDPSSIPAGSTIKAATLTLCATLVPSAARTYNVHRVTASWIETAITWNNQPAVAGGATDSSSTPATADCMTWAVSADVQLWIDGTANNGWRISDSVEDESGAAKKTDFRTREDTAIPADIPTLEIWYVPP